MTQKPVHTLTSQFIFQNELQIYINRAIEDFEVPLHNHEFIEFSYVMEGQGFHHIDNAVYPVRKGELCYIPIGISHVFRPTSSDLSKHPLIVYNCVFSREQLLKLNQFTASEETKQFIVSLHNHSLSSFSLRDLDESIEKLFVTMHREYSLRQLGSIDYLNSLMLQLLILVQRAKAQYSLPPQVETFTHFEQLLIYMEKHCTEELTLSHLAEKSLWSERHLQRLFIQHTEQNFSSYLQSLRIQKSREFLRKTQHKVSAIAGLVGYKDVGYFVSVFKRIVGMTPREYRKSFT